MQCNHNKYARDEVEDGEEAVLKMQKEKWSSLLNLLKFL